MPARPHFVGAGDANPGPHVYAVNTLPTEPSDRPLRGSSAGETLKRVGLELEFDAIVNNPI